MSGPIADPSGQSLQAVAAVGDKREPVFVADGREGPDLLDMREAIQPIAQLCAHRDTQTPLMIGIVGPSGSGKSFALERLRLAVAGLAAGAHATIDTVADLLPALNAFGARIARGERP